MHLEVLEQLPSLVPLEFFTVESQACYSEDFPSAKWMYRHALLPTTSEWLAEETFADVALSWNERGVFITVFVKKAFESCSYPRFSEGDAIELFFDTRDLKSAGFATRFCHHFIFLPQPVQGIVAQEITHFRTDDTHELCDPQELQVKSVIEKQNYTVEIFIPSDCLHGFDPLSFDRIGFTYRIHRYKGLAQHFALSGKHFSIAQHPRLWASFKLLKRS